MKILITGMSGFVGTYLKESLEFEHTVAGLSHRDCDFNDYNILKETILNLQPNIIYHLAAQSSPYIAWQEPYKTLKDNIISSLNFLRVAEELKIKLVLAGSAEVYDTQLEPLNENSKLIPRNPYGLSKLTVDFAARMVADERNINVTILRLFNHIGPKQSDRFVVSAFAKQLAEIALNKKENIVKVGNLKAQRDFLDVRDAISAYKLFLDVEEYGEVYNVCSGKAIEIQYILDSLIEISGLDVIVEQDPNRMRPSDIPIFQGDYSKIQGKFGWRPAYDVKDTLKDVYEYWLSELRD